ncbi:hypothetical protein [Pseudomonas endophytica]|uniref:hypothetical protein n=1 Tax=Pseudomonas endophytica TaxID=1563157 RepID=UPI001F4D12A3|nr:hypothetical protein [Pseudomonas endophytica]
MPLKGSASVRLVIVVAIDLFADAAAQWVVLVVDAQAFAVFLCCTRISRCSAS